jgi:3-oxoacyl-[acyl-carrier-protein] synthase II
MMVGEGAAVMVLESYDSAKSRDAKIYSEILGHGLSCDANHMTIPEVGGITSVMEKAVKNSGISIKDVDYICAHGTGTAINDKTESQAIRKVFYERGNQVPVSSIKSMLGHTMGAASALEAIASVLTINNNEIPPTINYETPDPECDIDCVPNKSRKKKVDVVLNNSFAFGGNNACVVLARA